MASSRLSPHDHRTDQAENIAFFVEEDCLPGGFLAIEVYSCSADQLENTFAVLLTEAIA
jgi:hypothetical protein